MTTLATGACGDGRHAPPIRWRVWAIYALAVAVAFVLFSLIESAGARLVAPAVLAGRAGASAKPAQPHVLLHVLLTLLTVIGVARLLGMLSRYLEQPPVIFEVLAGIMLGPSLLGTVAPGVSAFLIPPATLPLLQVLSEVGVVLFMFLVGLELDVSLLRTRTHAVVAISHASIVVPFLLGAVLALWLYSGLAAPGVSFPVFAMFLGVAMSVTAFPVLARILTDLNLHHTPLGMTVLSCAAVDDVTAWCLLAAAVGAAQAHGGSVIRTLVLTASFVGVVLVLARPALGCLARRQERIEKLAQRTLSLVLMCVLGSALAAEAIGIHALFGAFLLGAVIPSESRIARELAAKLEDVAVTLLLPVFFAVTGMRTQLGLLDGAAAWAICGVLIAVASLGKVGSSSLAARLAGLPWSEAAALGVLMNTRGLMQLVVLDAGLDLGVISPTLFTMMVVMSLVATLATSPILRLLIGRSPATLRGSLPE
ncbi:MAG TPA: cation:proton antiporter [Kofleriaceae bacterium]|nr:cation:proton antiporter [Kofleriaceae bacterium]